MADVVRGGLTDAVLSAASEGIALVDGEIHTRANGAYADMLGYDSADDVVGTRWCDRIAPEDRERVVDAVEQVRTEGGDRREVVSLQRTDGSTVHGAVSIRAADDRVVFAVEDRSDRRRRRVLAEALDAIDDLVFIFDEDGDLMAFNSAVDELRDDSDVVDEVDPRTFVHPDDQEPLPEDLANMVDLDDVHQEVKFVTPDGDLIPHDVRGATYEDEVLDERFRIAVARDISDRIEHGQTLRRRRDELETLNQINDLVLQIIRSLVEAPSREAVEEAVCEHLADSGLYDFAWIGETTQGESMMTPKTTAGRDGYDLRPRPVHDLDDPSACPGDVAVHTGEATPVGDVAEHPQADPFWQVVRRRGFRAGMAAPIGYRGTAYGLLSVYTDRNEAFTDREMAAFELLGEFVGFVINALENRRLLTSGTVVEVEIEYETEASFFVCASAELDARITLEGYVGPLPRDGGDSWQLYIDVDGGDPHRAVAIAETFYGEGSARVIRDDGDGGRIELDFPREHYPEDLTGRRAVIRSIVAESGTARMSIDLPPSTEVRQVVEDVRSTFPDAQMVAQRERASEPRTLDDVREELGDRLTDRQLTVLERAYLAGYFDWPRETNAEELAEGMDIASSTLHHHLRNGQHRLLSALFDADSTNS